MKIYNTLTRKKEDFITIEPNKVKMYVCGPTVYDFIHIGNARPYVTFDTVRRYFEYRGFEVTYVQNFTDIDDKIIKRASDENVTYKEISEKYIAEAEKDAKMLCTIPPTHTPRVTEEIDDIIDMIQNLLEKGNAYEKNGTVYFNTASFTSYGKLSQKNIDELESGARVDVDSDKKNPSDFVLWKPKKDGEPYWESPWGDGRPGWHIECSVMAKKYLGTTIDIHAGGEDLVFPHHENEIAQSEAANGENFAKYWLHNGFINIDNQKMSKSKGNFFTLREIAQEFSYEVIRFFLLSVHYRSPINFSREILKASESGLDRIKKCMFNLNYIYENASDVINDQESELSSQLQNYVLNFESKMDDDFNTADAISIIFEMVTFANKHINVQISKQFVLSTLETIQNLLAILGLCTNKNQDDTMFQTITRDEIECLVEERQQAKKAKNFSRADEIREHLKERGIGLEDTREGVRYFSV